MIKRELYMKQIRPFIGTDLVKVLTGIRRCGKSVMLELIQQELLESGISSSQFMSINFEQMNTKKFCTASALHEEVTKYASHTEGKFYLFFDEIQEVENWEICINSFRIDFDCDIYITGSNAKLLSGELATYLAGRYVEFIIYPFSFQEFLDMRKQKNISTDITTSFRDYIQIGGMPFLSNLIGNQDACNQYLRDIYNSAILKDVIGRNQVRDIDLLERITTYILANIGHSFSATSLSKFLKSEGRKVSPETILNYIKYCCDAFLFYKLQREDLVGKKILTIQEKYYVVDHGLREAVYGSNIPNIDQILENLVCMEALRRNYTITVGKKASTEIDFILKKNQQKIYIQVSYLLASPDTVEREFGVYTHISDNFPKYVISMDEFNMSRNGIKHKHIRDFLLIDTWE